MSDVSCGVIATDMGGLRDSTGCTLPHDHKGPHRFTGSDNRAYEWETDFDCECDGSCEEDWCFNYWEVGSHE